MFLPDPHGRTNWKRRAVLGILVVVLVGLGLAAQPGYRALKRWRAHHLAAEAERMADQDPRRAQEIAQAAWQLHPGDRVTSHAMALTLSRLCREDAFTYWRHVLGQTQPKGPDRDEIINLALQLKQFDLAEPLVRLAIASPDPSLTALRGAALVAESKGDFPAALKAGQIWLTNDLSNTDAKLFLARQYLITRDPKLAGEAKELLWQIVRAKAPPSAQALDLLAYLPNLSFEEIKECLSWLNLRPLNEPRRDFAMIDLHLRIEPDRQNELVRGAIAYYRTSSPPVLASLARWLSSKGEFAKVTEVISPEAAKGDQDLFLLVADALAAQGQWTQLERVLADPSLPIDPVLVELYQARVAGELKKERQKLAHWAQAQWLASTKPPMLRYLGQYAEKIGEPAQAEQAYRRLTSHPEEARGAWLGLIRIAERHNDTIGLRRILAEVSQAYPEDPVPQNDLAYVNLLLGENINAARQRAAMLVRAHPQMFSYRITLALAHLRANDPVAARKLFEDVTADWRTLTPGWQAVYIATLAANGETNRARELAAHIPRQGLKREEQKLLHLALPP